jgi:hypothetical protein
VWSGNNGGDTVIVATADGEDLLSKTWVSGCDQ